MFSTLLVVLALGGLVAWLVARSRGRARMRAARELATELIPEIRQLIDSSDPKSRSEGEPVAAKCYDAEQKRLPQVLPSEPLYAVETFYRCVESYRTARTHMSAFFAEDDTSSLGDRIRAKDGRDRCLKDVYLTGEAAVQKLETLLG
jgi:hypothetical protein